jgi:MFS superfamily sulfate permease-like transporter
MKVLSGFTTGAAIIIITGQFKGLFGVNISGWDFFAILVKFAEGINSNRQ